MRFVDWLRPFIRELVNGGGGQRVGCGGLPLSTSGKDGIELLFRTETSTEKDGNIESSPRKSFKPIFNLSCHIKDK